MSSLPFPPAPEDLPAESVLRTVRAWQRHLRDQRRRIEAELARAEEARRVARWALEQARRRGL